MNEWNDLLALNEADDEEKEEESDDKKEDKKDDDKSDDVDDTEVEDSEDNDYNDIIGDDDVIDNDDDDFNFDDTDDGTESPEGDENPSDATDDDYNTLIVAKVDGDAESESTTGSVYDAAAKLGYAFTVISNNMKHIHLNAAGEKFEELHEKCDMYYHYFNSKADWAFELASESPLVKLDNPTRAKEHCEDVEVEQETEYGFEDGFGAALRNLDAGIQYVNKLREAAEHIRPDIQSECDSLLTFLNKESKYFIRKRLATPGSDNVVAETEPMGECYNALI